MDQFEDINQTNDNDFEINIHPTKNQPITFPDDQEDKDLSQLVSRSTKRRKQHRKDQIKEDTKLLFINFRRSFFEVPSELSDPFYFSLIPNMTALSLWSFLFSFLNMIILTVLFCIFKNEIWQSFLCYFCFFVQTASAGKTHVMKQNSILVKYYQARILFILCHSTIETLFMILMKLALPYSYPVQIISHILWYTFVLPGIVQFITVPLAIRYNFLFLKDGDSMKHFARNLSLITFVVTTQILSTYFWIWGPPKILNIGYYVGSVLVVLLLNISKHAYVYMYYVMTKWIQPDIFYGAQLRCLYAAGFVEVLVFSHAFQKQFFFLVFILCLFDICEILYHAKALSDERDPILSFMGCKNTPQTFDIIINWRSSYIYITKIITVIVPLYFLIAISIFQNLDMNVWLRALGLEIEDTFEPSFILSMGCLIIWEIVTALFMRWILSRNDKWMLHDYIYLMKNYYEIMFVAPLGLVAYFLITSLSFKV